MVQQYNILKATAAGEPWPGSHGGMFQSYFLDIEGMTDSTIMCNRKVESAVPQGVLWGEMVDKQSKNGKWRKQFTVQKPPEDGQGALPLTSSQTRPERAGDVPAQKSIDSTISWGEAVLAACTLFKDVAPIDEITYIARELYKIKPTDPPRAPESSSEFSDGRPLPEPQGEVVLEDVPDEPVDLSEIPF